MMMLIMVILPRIQMKEEMRKLDVQIVERYPGIQIASIGPRIVEPHSTSERVELSTIDDIWRVLIELLSRLATPLDT